MSGAPQVGTGPIDSTDPTNSKPSLETLDYASWSLSFKERVGGKRVPLAGTLELTRRCNNRCRHCYNNLPANDSKALASELSTDEIKRILGETAAAGCVWLLLTGGEILLRPDFLEIYRHAKGRGLLVTLFTNGTLVTPKLADELAGLRPVSIEITLYGCTAETYEKVSGVPGSFRRCLEGVRLLMERGLPLKLKSTLCALNAHEIWEIKRFAEQELGLPFRFDALLNARCDGSLRPLEVRLAPEEVVALDLADAERMKALRDLAHRPPRAAPAPSGRAPLYTCGGGAHSFAIDPYGRLRACALSTGAGFDLRAGGFPAGWDRHLAQVHALTAEPDSLCTRCRLRSLCGMCPANGEIECGDPRRRVDFLCRVAHLRAYAMKMEIPAHGPCDYCPGGGRHGEMVKEAERLNRKVTSNEQTATIGDSENSRLEISKWQRSGGLKI
jgi:radical SAM protein with 4Fe4S-binding SPASM domain